ncbi:MAG: peptidyl-prolyl cis-trans isomerase [Tannerellaceae bacterium]|jgi:peptidyl-prolyl cis-trans isomerase SurA|nr:peptidyl-prolyl cis-trans isomerase [Tannerellaceae bacterium]
MTGTDFKGMKASIFAAVCGLLTVCAPLWAAKEVKSPLPDSVAMVVGGKPILLDDFLFIAQKNGEADLSSLEALHEYVELFKNFRLKVAEAESQGIDTTTAFHKEFGEYRMQLEDSYLSDKAAEDAVLRSVYDRGGELLEFSYILFRFSGDHVLRKDTAEAYAAAQAAYSRLATGENIDRLGSELSESGMDKVVYEYVPSLPPLRALRTLDKLLYTLPEGALSQPLRTAFGYYVVKMHHRHRHPGRIHVAHILVGLTSDTLTRTPEEARAIADSLYERLLAGEDFVTLAQQYSTDAASARNGGEMRPFGPNEMIAPFEQAAFALKEVGDISPVVETRFGYHIIRLIEKLPRASFENERTALEYRLSRSEHNFDLYRSFDERMRREYDYTPFPDAYAELEALCDVAFPADSIFAVLATNLDRPLFVAGGIAVSQRDFARFMSTQRLSSKTYAPEYMREAYDLFLRELLTGMERQNLQTKHPEYKFLLQEYRDGILLFEVSNNEIWTKPVKQQDRLEKKWLKKLRKKFPVEINWEVINRQVRQP